MSLTSTHARVRGRRAAALGVLAVLVLAGCSPDPESSPTAEPTKASPTASPSPSPSPTPTVTTPAPAPSELARAEGETFAQMQIARFGADWSMPIHEGISDEVLDRDGLGHFPTSALLGGTGNFALAGHRTQHSAPLYDIDLLVPGDPIVITTATGTFTYQVTTSEIVEPTEVRVVSPNPFDPEAAPTTSLLTLVACHPKGSVAQRWITYAELVSAESVVAPGAENLPG